jgi:hypothetical protein
MTRSRSLAPKDRTSYILWVHHGRRGRDWDESVASLRNSARIFMVTHVRREKLTLVHSVTVSVGFSPLVVGSEVCF